MKTTHAPQSSSGPRRRGNARAQGLRDAKVRQEATDNVFRALGNDTRRDILYLLHLQGGPLHSVTIAEQFGVSWQAISRHLRILTEAGLLTYAPHGRDRVYSIDRRQLQEVAGGWIKMVAAKGARLPEGVAF